MSEYNFEIGDYAVHGFGHHGKITDKSENTLPSGIKAVTYCVRDKGFDNGDGCNEVWFAENEMRPIPITEDRLRRNGFVNATPKMNPDVPRYEWRGSKGYPCVSVEAQEPGDTPNYIMAVDTGRERVECAGRYIHDLQQLIRKSKIVKNLIV